MEDIIGLIVAIVIVAVVIILQVFSFVKTRMKILELGSLFDDVEKLSLKETSLTPSVLRSKSSLQKFLENIPKRHVKKDDDEEVKNDYTDLSLLNMSGDSSGNGRFGIIINRTNEYLCKNTGTSADLGILEDICDNQKNALDDEIHNTLNVPLYLGLAGTFVGIMTGLAGIDFEAVFGSEGMDMSGLQHLLYGVSFAMIASFLGLGLTVFNSAISYKNAVSRSNDGKEEYMDFLRRELMPLLSNSMASSLNSLRGVLGHFVDKFGRNLNAYADSAELLNDNLEKQHLVLEEINKLSLTQTSNKIAEIFAQLKDSADTFSVFQNYQKQLNTTVNNVSGVVTKIQTLVDKFDEFAAGLSVVVDNQNKSAELQQKFQEAIDVHFPTGSDARAVWRKEFDLIINEGQQVSESLSKQLTASTEHIQNFIANNKDFFDTFDKMKEVLATMVQYTQIQAECYKDLKGEIFNMRKDYKDAQQETIDLHETMLKAIEAMTNAIMENKKTTELHKSMLNAVESMTKAIAEKKE